jgi:sporulation protein YlmC with PRC-barrel domain
MEINIPLNAEVHCQDGVCGEANCVIIDPHTQQVTHYVVKEKRSPHVEKLVPEMLVSETTLNSIALRCCADDLTELDNFKETRFESIDVEVSKMSAIHFGADSFAYWPRVKCEIQTVALEKERLPKGELAIRRGIGVFATDGAAGKVDEFLVDSEDGRITHLIMHEGHLWNQKEVTIPISQIDRIDQYRVYLKLDKRRVKALPTTFLRRWF